MARKLYQKRVWEIDFLRGLAVLCMVYYHLVYHLKNELNYPVDYETGFNFYVGRISAFLFIGLAGISCVLSRNNAMRGFRILLIALVISLVSYMYKPEYIIVFGILHFLGLSMIIATAFNRVHFSIPLLLSIVCFALYPTIKNIAPSSNTLFFLGIINKDFHSADYYPLIPYFGIFALGITVGKILYRDKKSIFSSVLPDNFVNFIGRYSLSIYLIHVPAILLIFMVYKLFFVKLMN